MSLPAESVLICEGYHDRAFLRGWLTWLGCEGLLNKPYRGEKPLRGAGQYGFKTPSGGWLRILPVDGDTKVTLAAEELIIQSATKPIARIVLVYDADDPHPTPRGGARQSDFDAWAIKQQASRVPDTEEFELTGGMVPTRLSIVVWGAPDAASALLPPQQTLERLVCAALAEAYPTRGKAVSVWLASRPEPPAQEKLNKTHAASHMAGWFSDRGYEGLFDAVWEDAAVREALLARLGATGSARVINELVGAPG